MSRKKPLLEYPKNDSTIPISSSEDLVSQSSILPKINFLEIQTENKKVQKEVQKGEKLKLKR